MKGWDGEGDAQQAKLDAVEVLVDLVQMFREREETFTLALGVMKRVVEHRKKSSSSTSSSSWTNALVELRRRLAVTLNLLEKKYEQSTAVNGAPNQSGRAAGRCARRLRHILEIMGGGYSHPGLMAVQAELTAKAEAKAAAKTGKTGNANSYSESSPQGKMQAAVLRVRAHRRALEEMKRREHRKATEEEAEKKRADFEKRKQLQAKMKQRRASKRWQAAKNAALASSTSTGSRRGSAVRQRP